MKKILGIALMATMAGAAMAQVTYGPGAGFAIPDSPAAGASSDIVIGAGGPISSMNWVSLNVTHTWAGDLIARITHVDTGTEVHLFSRVGSTTAGGAGDSSNLDGTYRFFETGASFAAAAAAAPGTNDLIATGDYARSSHALGAGAGLSNGVLQYNANTFANFAGESLAGTWRLTVSDHAGADLGSVAEWHFNATAVPEPASMAALGLGVAALLRRRRK